MTPLDTNLQRTVSFLFYNNRDDHTESPLSNTIISTALIKAYSLTGHALISGRFAIGNERMKYHLEEDARRHLTLLDF